MKRNCDRTTRLGDRPDNLYEPVPGGRGAHGRFDERAKSSSPQLWADTHRGLLAGALVAVTAGVLISSELRARSRQTLNASGRAKLAADTGCN
jgi:hypothetical protein